MTKTSIAAMKHTIADSLVLFLKDQTGEALELASDIAAIELLALAAHLHMSTGKDAENFLQRAYACYLEVQCEGAASAAMQ